MFLLFEFEYCVPSLITITYHTHTHKFGPRLSRVKENNNIDGEEHELRDVPNILAPLHTHTHTHTSIQRNSFSARKDNGDKNR